jgi:CHAT domain
VKTVLVLAANPIESVRVQFQKELSEIQEAWKRSKVKDGFEVKFEPAATWAGWRRGLLDYDPEIVHFIGHGVGVNGIVLEGDSGQEVVSGERLAQLLLEFSTVRCVVLNACHSKVQATEIFERVGHLRCAIGMKQSIAQESARQFAIAFYDSVFSGRDYGVSFRLGKTGINSRYDVTSQ